MKQKELNRARILGAGLKNVRRAMLAMFVALATCGTLRAEGFWLNFTLDPAGGGTNEMDLGLDLGGTVVTDSTQLSGGILSDIIVQFSGSSPPTAASVRFGGGVVQLTNVHYEIVDMGNSLVVDSSNVAGTFTSQPTQPFSVVNGGEFNLNEQRFILNTGFIDYLAMGDFEFEGAYDFSPEANQLDVLEENTTPVQATITFGATTIVGNIASTEVILNVPLQFTQIIDAEVSPGFTIPIGLNGDGSLTARTTIQRSIAPMPGALAAQVVVTGTSSANTSATVLHQTPGPELRVADSPPNFGDLSLVLEGNQTLPYNEGVVFANANQLRTGGIWQRNVIGQYEGTGNDGFANTTFLSTFQIAASSTVAAAAEQNVNVSLMQFPFAQGWTAGHVNALGTVVAGNADGTTVSRTVDAQSNVIHRVSIDGVDSRSDGMLFAIGGANGAIAASVGSLPDGSGWDVRLAGDGQSFPSTSVAAWSYVYVPFQTPNLVAAGHVELTRDGGSQAVYSTTNAVGDFTVEPVDFGPNSNTLNPPGGAPDGLGDEGRYLIKIPGKTSETGILAVTVNSYRTNSAGIVFGADDNLVAYQYDATLGGFLVESYDLPNGALQDTGIDFFYFDFASPIMARTAGDLDGDFDVDRADLARFVNKLGRQGNVAFSDGDFDDDGKVTLKDLALLQRNFSASGQAPSPAAAAVPEPSSLALLMLGAGLFSVRRRRGR